ncbi:MAG: hypothetical protein HOM58_20905 [Rhodospirillaceae bacterium]|jgi:hypothetical protein|nr:hypothetical protein [Rhodospirillaceae bacterium]MBT5455347.1 hypothetical protein [Rhodospirillaceae bacterium]
MTSHVVSSKGWKWGLRLSALVVVIWCLDAAIYYIFHDGRDDIRGLFVAENSRGYALKPGFRGVVTDGYAFNVATNSRGYRGAEWRLNEKFRVLMAGNSFVFGLPLPAKDGIVGKMRAQVSADVGIYNVGVPSYGVLQSLETIRRECPVIKPRHVVYAMDFNDFRRDHMDLRSRTVVDGYKLSTWSDDRLKRLPTPLSKAEVNRQKARLNAETSWSLRQSLQLRSIRMFLAQRYLHPRQIAERLLPDSILGAGYRQRYVFTTRSEFGFPDVLKEATAAIRDMATAAHACGASFTLVVFPNASEAYYQLTEPATETVLTPLLASTMDILDLRKRAARGENLARPRSGYYHARATHWAATEITRHLAKRYPVALKMRTDG